MSVVILSKRSDVRHQRIAASGRSRQSGFTLVEFMVAITISLVVLAALSAMFVSSSRARDELQKANEQIENGRYATQLLSDDLQMAGYYGEFDISNSGLDGPDEKPDPCATALATLNTNFPVYIQGYDNSNGGLSCLPADYRANTDVIVIRRVSTCADCANAVANAPYFQASLCNQADELGDPDDPSKWYRLAIGQGNANLDRTGINCNPASPAAVRRLMTHIYFIANNNQAGDGIPTLKRAELRGSNFTITALVEGIQNLQVEYGIDTDNNGTPDNFTANPDTFGGCNPGPPAVPAGCVVANWRNVVASKVHFLARSTEATFGHEDKKTYFLGLDAANAANSVGPLNDGFKRHVFSTLVRIQNPAERR